MDKFLKKVFCDFYHDKYHLKFRDMFFSLYDYLTDNKINIYICIDEYNDPFFGDFLENYEEKEPYISTLVISLFCLLKSLTDTKIQKEMLVLYFENLNKILDSKYKHKSYCSIYTRIKNNFNEKLEEIQIKNKIAIAANMIDQKEQDFETIQKIIHNLMNDLFNTNDFINDWTSIGFYSFYLSIKNNINKIFFIRKYLTYLVEFNNINKIYYSKGLFRNEFIF